MKSCVFQERYGVERPAWFQNSGGQSPVCRVDCGYSASLILTLILILYCTRTF